MIERYLNPEINSIWDDQNKFDQILFDPSKKLFLDSAWSTEKCLIDPKSSIQKHASKNVSKK